MTISARRAATAGAIHRAAMRLALDHGYDGFTMDDLARVAGVSRRTLFNYVGSKEEAVLGPIPSLDQERVRAFREGRPSGDLLSDLIGMVPRIWAEENDRDTALLKVSILNGDVSIVSRAHARVRSLLGEGAEHLAYRLGTSPDDPRIRFILGIMALLITTSFEDFGSEGPSGRELPDIIRDNVVAIREIAELFTTVSPSPRE